MCTICTHPLRIGIEKDTVAINAFQVSKQYGVSLQALYRHMRLHAGVIAKEQPFYLPPADTPEGHKVVVEDQNPITIPNAYQQLEELRANLTAIINEPLVYEKVDSETGESKPVNDWIIMQDRQYRLGAMRELRATIAATLKLWEAQQALNERYSGHRPLQASIIYAFMRERHPEVLSELLDYLKQQRIAV